MELQGQQKSVNCPKCQLPPDQSMITCTNCHKSYHTSCTITTSDLTYKCQMCISLPAIESTAESIKSTSTRASNRSNKSQRRLQLELQRLEEERVVSMEFISKKYKIIEQQDEIVSEDSSSRSLSVRNWLKELPHPVQSEPKTQPESLNLNKTTKQAPHQPDKTFYCNMPPQASNVSIEDNSNRIKNNVPLNNPPINTTAATTSSSVPTSGRAIYTGYEQRQQPSCQSLSFPQYLASTATSVSINRPITSYQNITASSSHFTQQNPTNYSNFTSTRNCPSIGPPHLLTNLNISPQLNQGQLQARNSLPKELPIFSGQPEEWPLFSSTYDWSTKICGYTDAENLIRLQKSLKGEALQNVQQILVHPSNVTWVMSILKLLYGQPEKIVNSIKNRIKTTPSIDENNLPSFTAFAINVKSLIATIEASNLLNEINNSSLLHELLQKLPPAYQLQWGTQKLQLINQNKNPNMYEFANWIFNIGISASCITVESSSNNRREKAHNISNNSNKKAYIHTHNDDRKCFVCNNNKCKAISNCQKYLSLNRGDKWDIIRKHKLCKSCLCKHSGECKKKVQCGVQGCQYYHHSSLHRYSHEENNNNNTVNNNNTNSTHVSNISKNINAHSDAAKQVLFKIIPITVYGKNKQVETFAFIDEGSSISLMDETLMEDLEMSGSANPLCLKWTGGIERYENSSKKLTIKISGGNKKQISINVCTVSELNLPSQTLDYKNLAQRFHHLQNLPIESYCDAIPRLLIGLNHFNLAISTKIRQGAPHEPVAVCTNIGWLIYGAVVDNAKQSKHYNFHICDCSKIDEGLDELVKNFYSLDSIGICCNKTLVGKDDERALNLLKNFTQQRKDGHYETPLLWKFDVLSLPDSYEMANKRLLCLERKLKHNFELYSVFKTTIEKYLAKGYIRKLTHKEINSAEKVWYLPIFAVFNKNKPGKSRVVWDAAAKSNGVSLNSFLLKGPDMLASLPAILFSFRQRAVAICGDIEEMFHQIFIRSEDRNVQRFLWRDCNNNKEPDVYVMDVMIFGATCAPSISQYIKNLNAETFKNEFSVTVKAIQQNHYVDDLLDSVDTPQEAKKLISDVIYIHRQGGFNIRNWISNNKEVTNSISDGNAKDKKCLNLNEEKQTEKVLGVFWEHQDDVITFKISTWLVESDIFLCTKIPTKREMLRLVMSIYDPLGLIGNIIMYVKILLQEVWRSKVDWDEEISQNLMTKWTQWVKILPNIQQIKIPRCYLRNLHNYDGVNVQLHTFVDASKDGYAAVSYFRLVKNGAVICSLIGSKTRVAPIKITSVPRLELMAALIGARFSKFICENHNIEISKKFFWSDSKTVLSWINSDHRKYNQFVAFRVTEILELSSMNDWRWTPTKQNVADEATKWARIPQIESSSRWFKGPEFLYQNEDEWPRAKIYEENTPEEMVHRILKITSSEKLINEKRFSKWNRMIRAVAYFFRFIKNCRTKVKSKGEFTQEELLKAENFLYQQAQLETYSKEIHCLETKTAITKSSEIFSKSPILDEFGVLRMDGRIDNADVPHEQKHPIILSRSSYITSLIILHYHTKYYHINHETIINEIRQKYSISNLRVAVKKIVRKCQWCIVYNAVPHVPQMAKLPRARLALYEAPFTYTGVDFFGPIMVTVNRHREKRYGCLFTCLTVRAVHIEVAHSLTTDSCILAIRNFMARRGIPRELFSDNGTNFIGAERELREALEEVDKNEFVKTFANTTTKWNFNPPSSPHMGGAWERLVRSVKTVLYKIMPSRAPSDELLLSMLTEVENIVNSRPLAYVPVHDETDEAVTPNHFLVGSSSGLKPMSSCNDSGVVLKQNWLIAQQYANIFWKKWLAEFLPSLTCRSKWFEKQKPLRQGDLVVIVDPSLPRNIWLRGKVTETRLAKDGQVRSAMVLTSRGILERPVAKLAVLEVASQVECAGEDPTCHTVGGNVADPAKIC